MDHEPRLIFARHGLGALASHLLALGTRRVLVLSGASRRGVDALLLALEAFSPTVFDGARVHVPGEVLDRADACLAACGADTIVALGGGAPIGLGKALRLAHEGVRFAAIPTTYAGSERTSTFGVTREREKKTGRDPRVRPDVILYDPSLTEAMPIALTVQSLFNALAHVLSVVSTGSLAGAERDEALAGAASVIRAAEDLLIDPMAARPREHAMRAASACGLALERGKPGTQHALAHLLGGALGLEHAALHAMLLPHFVAHLRGAQSALVDELETSLGRRDLDARLHDLLVRAGAPVSLDAIGADATRVAEALSTRPELPAEVARDAQHGLRPSGRGGRLALGEDPAALCFGPPPERAARIALVLHGRGAEAGAIGRRMREIAGHDPSVSIVSLRAPAGADRWYAVRFSEPSAGSDPEVLRAIARVEAAIDALRALAPGTPLVLAGFSQGACLALEVAARHRGPLAAVIAPCGARLGAPDTWADVRLDGIPVLLGANVADEWVPPSALDATAAWLARAGARVDDLRGQGTRHEITPRQRMRARELLTGVAMPPGPLGFGNTLACEALPGALPPVQNSPRLPPYGLVAEQISGTGFTAHRAENQRTWMYRVRPSSERRAFVPLSQPHLSGSFEGAPEIDLVGIPPLAAPDTPRDFVDGLFTICGAGSAALRRGYAFHVYAADRSMDQRAFYDADGDLLILPEHGALTLLTELGAIDVAPGQLALVPCGVLFSVLLRDPFARGYVAEPFGRHFRLPERGLVGANGLADARHFRAPSPWYEDRLVPGTRIAAKLGGRLHETTQDHSPFDVVAFHGNHVPWVYDLDAFSPVGNTRFDHGDPSIHTVLSAPLDEAGAHTLDLVVFAPRWDPTTGTFRPPFFHRNVTAEINGIVREHAPEGSAFQPGVCFLTPPMTAHGVSGVAVERSRAQREAEADAPLRLGHGSLWFQLESALAPVLTPWASAARAPSWASTWSSHASRFETDY